MTREREIRANFREAVGYEPSTGSHTEPCPECDNGEVVVHVGAFGRVVEYQTCWLCDGSGERVVADDPRWGWALAMELGDAT